MIDGLSAALDGWGDDPGSPCAWGQAEQRSAECRNHGVGGMAVPEIFLDGKAVASDLSGPEMKAAVPPRMRPPMEDQGRKIRSFQDLRRWIPDILQRVDAAPAPTPRARARPPSTSHAPEGPERVLFRALEHPPLPQRVPNPAGPAHGGPHPSAGPSPGSTRRTRRGRPAGAAPRRPPVGLLLLEYRRIPCRPASAGPPRAVRAPAARRNPRSTSDGPRPRGGRNHGAASRRIAGGEFGFHPEES